MKLRELYDQVITEAPKYTYGVMYDGHQIATIESGRPDIKYCVVTYWEKLGIRNKPYIHSRTDSMKVVQRRLSLVKQDFDDQRDIPRKTDKLGSRISVIATLKQLSKSAP